MFLGDTGFFLSSFFFFFSDCCIQGTLQVSNFLFSTERPDSRNHRSSFSLITHFITLHCSTDTREQIEPMSVCILAADAPFCCRCEEHPPGPFQGALPFLDVCSCLFRLNRSTSRTPPNHSRRREAPPTHIFHLLRDTTRATED